MLQNQDLARLTEKMNFVFVFIQYSLYSTTTKTQKLISVKFLGITSSRLFLYILEITYVLTKLKTVRPHVVRNRFKLKSCEWMVGSTGWFI